VSTTCEAMESQNAPRQQRLLYMFVLAKVANLKSPFPILLFTDLFKDFFFFDKTNLLRNFRMIMNVSYEVSGRNH
jgi:hypothetical protein